MQPEAPKLLEDIRAAAAYILDKTGGKTLNQYLAGGWHAQAEGAGMVIPSTGRHGRAALGHGTQRWSGISRSSARA